MNKRILYFVCILLVIAAACKKGNDVLPVLPPDNDHLLLGNPTNAQASLSFPENYLKDNLYYKIAYSNSRGEPIWVAWHMQSEDWGSTTRQDDFRADTGLPGSWYSVQSTSYAGSGFDRGHNCPSADRTNSIVANSSTFLMSNIIPEAPNFNQGPWAGLEDFIRDSLVGNSNEAFILTGSYGAGGYGSNGSSLTINNGHITVPARVYKVVIALAKGNDDLSRINSATIVLAVCMPNDNRLFSTSPAGRREWRNYIRTINEVELDAATFGQVLNMLGNLNTSLSQVLKGKRFQ